MAGQGTTWSDEGALSENPKKGSQNISRAASLTPQPKDQQTSPAERLEPSVYQLICQQLVNDGHYQLTEKLMQRASLTELLSLEDKTTYCHDLATLLLSTEMESRPLHSQNELYKLGSQHPIEAVETHRSFLDKLKAFVRGSQQSMPEKDILSQDECIVTAAICIVRAAQMRSPTFCRPGKLKLFVVIHNRYYRMLWLVLFLTHLALIWIEVPPRFYGENLEQLQKRGYHVNLAKFIDIGIVVFYVIHWFLWTTLEGGIVKGLKSQRVLGTFCLTLLLLLDAIISVSTPAIARPFRPLRPLMFVFNSTQLSRAMTSVSRTLIPLLKAFGLLICYIFFYSLLGYNLFEGYVSKSRQFFNQTEGLVFEELKFGTYGAACSLSTGFSHPLSTFGDSVLNFYVLATSDNFPAVMLPFLTCGCALVPNNSTCLVDFPETYKSEALECALRKAISYSVFLSYTAVMIFCLGNVVLAVCYTFYESAAKNLLMVAALKRRESLLEAFYYLNEGGYIKKEMFLECAAVARSLSLGQSGDREADIYFFNTLDQDRGGTLDMIEFFSIIDMMKTKIKLGHRPQDEFQKKHPIYAKWKTSRLRKLIVKFLGISLGRFTLSDVMVDSLIITNALVASIASLNEDYLQPFSNFVTIIFTAELLLKFFGVGMRAFWSNGWNRFDTYILLVCISALIGADMSRRDHIPRRYEPLFELAPILRLIRLAKTLSTVTAQSGFYSRVIFAIKAAVPACRDVLILIFLFIYFSAVTGMEMLGANDANARTTATGDGFVDFINGNELFLDFAQFSSAMFAVYTVTVGNTWSSSMFAAMSASGSWFTSLFFLFFHFVGTFLMLNIVQSVFVFAFSTILTDSEFNKTKENDLTKLDTRIKDKMEPKVVGRGRTVDNLMLQSTAFDESFQAWILTRSRPQIRSMWDSCQEIYMNHAVTKSHSDAGQVSRANSIISVNSRTPQQSRLSRQSSLASDHTPILQRHTTSTFSVAFGGPSPIINPMALQSRPQPRVRMGDAGILSTLSPRNWLRNRVGASESEPAERAKPMVLMPTATMEESGFARLQTVEEPCNPSTHPLPSPLPPPDRLPIGQIRAQALFHNPAVWDRATGEALGGLRWARWVEAGVATVGDVFDEAGHLRSDELRAVFADDKRQLKEDLKAIAGALPRGWRRVLRGE